MIPSIMAFQDEIQSERPQDEVVTPFAHTEASLSGKGGDQKKRRSVFLISATVALLLCGILAAFFLNRYLNDPLRTKEALPVGKYFENYKSLIGAKFKGDLRVEADLGWEDGVGRLMLFSLPSDTRPVAVLIPVNLADIYFVKGQVYLAELEIKDGGLIYATSCRKY